MNAKGIMGSGTLLGNVLTRLGLRGTKDPGPSGAEPPIPFGPTRAEMAAFEQRLSFLLGRWTGEAQDNIFVIDISKCRDHLGPRWPEVRDKIHAKVQGILNTRLTRQELFLQRDEVSYLVVFAGATRRNAQIRALVVNQAINERLYGQEDTGEAVEVRSIRVDSAGNVEVDKEPEPEEILDYVPEATLWSKPRDHSRRMRGIKRKPAKLDDVRVFYRPMLAIRTRIVSTFMCLPIRHVREHFHASSYDVLGPGATKDDLFALDSMTLRHTGETVTRMVRTGSKSLVALSVHYETLAETTRRSEYIALCAKVLAGNTSRVVFEVVGLPAGVPEVRLTELVTALRLNSRAIIVRVAPDCHDFAAFRATGVHAVGLDLYESRRREQALFPEIEAFVQAASNYSLKTYLFGVRSLSIYTAALAAGFDYAAGHALTTAVETPEKAYLYRMETPYLSLLAAPGPSNGSSEPLL